MNRYDLVFVAKRGNQIGLGHGAVRSDADSNPVGQFEKLSSGGRLRIRIAKCAKRALNSVFYSDP